MSKKKGKPPARKAPKKKASKKASASARIEAIAPAPEREPRTKTANVFIFKTDSGVRIRTSPQRIYVNHTDSVEFNVVNMVDGSDVDVTIEFPGGGPWGNKPFTVRNWARKRLAGAAEGRFKYVVRAMGVEEDPELEIPEGPP